MVAWPKKALASSATGSCSTLSTAGNARRQSTGPFIGFRGQHAGRAS